MNATWPALIAGNTMLPAGLQWAMMFKMQLSGI